MVMNMKLIYYGDLVYILPLNKLKFWIIETSWHRNSSL